VSLEGDSPTVAGVLDHTLLTSIFDQRGVLRVQYLGVRFDPEEFRRDLLNLLQE
jgi:protein SCO1